MFIQILLNRARRRRPFTSIALALCALTPACRAESQRSSSPASAQPKATAGQAAPASGLPAATASETRRDEVIWDRLGAWSGKGRMQTESFTGATGALRIQWATKSPSAPDGGSFHLTIHSAISGRPLQVAVDQKGPGADTAYVNEDPRVFFAVVEASNLEWSFAVDEAIATRRSPTAKAP